jgi:membrane associated rhomboid family serine protease
MIPVQDEPEAKITPFVNYLIIISCITIFIWQIAGGRSHFVETVEEYGLLASEILRGENFHTLLTSIFFHGGLIHLGGNMLFVFVFGDNIESSLGHLRYLFFYVLSGVLANLIWVFLGLGGNRPALGASGAVSGVLGAYFVIYPNTRITSLITVLFFWPIQIPAYLMIGLWFIYHLTLAIFSGDIGVAFWIHVIGFFVGLLFLVILRLSGNVRKKQEG